MFTISSLDFALSRLLPSPKKKTFHRSEPGVRKSWIDLRVV